MVKRMSRKTFGDVPEPVEVAWHNRKVLNFSFSLGRKVQKWDQCDENLKSFAHMAVASLADPACCSRRSAGLYPRIGDEGPQLAGRSALPAKIGPRASSPHVLAVACFPGSIT
jgi:hypothetical protein